MKKILLVVYVTLLNFVAQGQHHESEPELSLCNRATFMDIEWQNNVMFQTYVSPSGEVNEAEHVHSSPVQYIPRAHMFLNHNFLRARTKSNHNPCIGVSLSSIVDTKEQDITFGVSLTLIRRTHAVWTLGVMPGIIARQHTNIPVCVEFYSRVEYENPQKGYLPFVLFTAYTWTYGNTGYSYQVQAMSFVRPWFNIGINVQQHIPSGVRLEFGKNNLFAVAQLGWQIEENMPGFNVGFIYRK